MLKRAVSTAYYGMFHALSKSNADVLVSATPAGPDIELWLDIYRTLDHREAKDKLASYRQKSPVPEVSNFAAVFAGMQTHRHNADYNPLRSFTRAEVSTMIDRAEAATKAFWSLAPQRRRALAAGLLVPTKSR